jgi:hypothetical protein
MFLIWAVRRRIQLDNEFNSPVLSAPAAARSTSIGFCRHELGFSDRR